MRNNLPRGLVPSLTALLAMVASCAPSMIPGTQIPDNKVNRELLRQVELYREAVERKDAPAVLDMVSESYFDTRGHPDDPTYHWDYKKLKEELPQQLAVLKDIRLEIIPRRIEVKDDRARVSYLFTEDFTAHLPSGDVPKHESELNRMEFQKIDKRWLITRGL